MFKLLALRILQAPDHAHASAFAKIKKVLRTRCLYRFCDGFEEEIEQGMGDMKTMTLPEDFFSLDPKKERSVKIHISAIVGKNGEGKSSVVELMIRMLNNLAYVIRNKNNKFELLYVRNIYALLFFTVDDALCSIKIEDEKLSFSMNGEVKLEFTYKGEKSETKGDVEKIKPFLFYTLVFNESMFAYNSNDFRNEADEKGQVWMDKLFHKRDGYQVSIVLNPARVKGNMDVNTENTLANQRMLSMFIYQPSLREAFHAKGISCILRKSIPFFDVTLRECFQENLFANVLTSATATSTMFFKLDMAESRFLWGEIRKILHGYLPFVRKCKELIVQLRNEESLKNPILPNYQSDIKMVLDEHRPKIKIQLVADEKIFREYGLENINYMQWLRIITIVRVERFWDKKLELNGKLRKLLNNQDLERYLKGNGDKADYNRALLYLLYKTIDSTDLDVFGKENLLDFTLGLGLTPAIERFLERLEVAIDRKNFTTLKLRQVIFYIKTYNSPVFDWNKILKANENTGSFSFADMKVKIEEYKWKHHLKDFSLEEMLPPRIYEVTPIFDRDGFEVSYQVMSSGERQLIMILAGILYHVRNLSTSAETPFYYPHVNIILEEIELYSHPEYQRQFLTKLIGLLEKLDFGKIRDINILMVTHSPFILSDIPKSNVLFLENGKPVDPMQENTFGANIHSLLKNGFFLSGMPMGDFAKQKINALFAKLNDGHFSVEEYKAMENEILMVGEPYLRGKLLELYGQFSYKLILDNLQNNTTDKR